jgi:tRNA 5-methylaminomethyl-2-thiouridine biosynthesis bifunctional protein
MKISPAKISFNEHQTPCSSEYQDVYFSNNCGAQETQYVFIEGNGLWERFVAHKNRHFCIGETGFGTGANFFCVAHEFYRFRQSHPNHPLKELVFISCEKHPIDLEDAANIWSHWQTSDFFSIYNLPNQIDGKDQIDDKEQNEHKKSVSQRLISQWCASYPLSIQGQHRRHFLIDEATIILDLHYDEALDAFENIKQQGERLVDAWFLDGFAPSKNASMWQPPLFEIMAQLSKSTASLATFTAAGDVKRGLISAGFDIRKRKGFGRKRDMLVGTIAPSLSRKDDSAIQHKLDKNQAPYYFRKGLNQEAAKAPNKAPIAIVGGGLAGAIMALKCVQNGLACSLFWQNDSLADGASGNPIGGFYPQLNAQNNYASQLQVQSFLYARHFYDELAKQSDFAFKWCGALQLGFNDNTKARLNKLANSALWPSQLARTINAKEASKIANIDIPYDCLYMPLAGWISPPSLVNACIRLAMQTGLLSLHTNTKLDAYHHSHQDIVLEISHPSTSKTEASCIDKQEPTLPKTKRQYIASALVLATGHETASFVESLIPLRLTRGQVELIKPNTEFKHLDTLLCHKGYFTPAVNGFHAMGSTYVKNDINTDVRNAETTMNVDMHCKSIKDASWRDALFEASQNKTNQSRAAVRCSTPDHIPLVGNMPSFKQFEELKDLYKAKPLHHYPQGSVDENVFILSGLGSRGLTTAPLLAELLLSQLLEKPLPLPAPLLDALSPNRFIVKSLIRRQAINF